MEAQQSPAQTMQGIYQQKLAAVHELIMQWWEQKLQADQQRNAAERALMQNIFRELEATSVVMTRLLKTFSDEHHGRRGVVRSYIKGVANHVKSISNLRNKSTEVTEQAAMEAFLQRVENSLRLEVSSYEKKASDFMRSLQIRFRGIEDCLLTQRKAILQKAKVKSVVTHPYTYGDINNLDQLVMAEIRSRTLLHTEIQECIANLAREEYRTLSSFHDNLQSLAATYPQKFNDNFLYPAMLAELKKMLEKQEPYRLKYYTSTGAEELKTQSDFETARGTIAKLSQNFEQRLIDGISFQKVYNAFMDELGCRKWSLQLLTQEKGSQWQPCTGVVLLSGSFLLMGRLRQLIDEYTIRKTEITRQGDQILRLQQVDKPRGLRRLFRSEKKHSDLIRFASEEQLEVFELHCSRCR